MSLTFPEFRQVCDLYCTPPFFRSYMTETASSWTSSCKKSVCRLLFQFLSVSCIFRIQRIVWIAVFNLFRKFWIFVFVVNLLSVYSADSKSCPPPLRSGRRPLVWYNLENMYLRKLLTYKRCHNVFPGYAIRPDHQGICDMKRSSSGTGSGSCVRLHRPVLSAFFCHQHPES